MQLQSFTAFMVAAALTAVCLAGCSRLDSESVSPAGESSGQLAVSDPDAGLDLSTPGAAVQAFIDAAMKKDVDSLAQTIHADCTSEFKPLLEKTTEPKMLDELAAMFAGAVVGDSIIEGDTAKVSVKLSSRNEELNMAKSQAGWQLVDF